MRSSVALAAALLLAAPALAHDAEPAPADCALGTPFLFQGMATSGCAIDAPGETDLVQFIASPGDVFRVLVFADDPLDPRVVVRDPTDAVIADEVCQSTGAGCPIAIELDALVEPTGVYDVDVSDDGGDETGGYVVQAERIPPLCDAPPLCDTADYLTWDDDTFADFQPLTVPTDMDHVLVEVSRPERLRMALERAVVPELEPRLEVFDPTLQLLDDIACTPIPDDAPREEIDGVVCATSEVEVGDETCSEEAPCLYSFHFSDDGWDESSVSGGYIYRFSRLPEPAGGAAAALASLYALARRRR